MVIFAGSGMWPEHVADVDAPRERERDRQDLRRNMRSSASSLCEAVAAS